MSNVIEVEVSTDTIKLIRGDHCMEIKVPDAPQDEADYTEWLENIGRMASNTTRMLFWDEWQVVTKQHLEWLRNETDRLKSEAEKKRQS